MKRRIPMVLLAGLVLAGSSLALSLEGAAATGPASAVKKRCTFVVKKVHGKRVRVRVCHTVPSKADLSITISTSASSVQAGTNVVYTMRVSNAGPDPASSVIVTDPLPPALSLISATATQGDCSGTTTVTCR